MCIFFVMTQFPISGKWRAIGLIGIDRSGYITTSLSVFDEIHELLALNLLLLFPFDAM